MSLRDLPGDIASALFVYDAAPLQRDRAARQAAGHCGGDLLITIQTKPIFSSHVDQNICFGTWINIHKELIYDLNRFL
jgi:hypothetical protein